MADTRSEPDSDEIIRIEIGPLDGPPWKTFTFTRVRLARLDISVIHLLQYIDAEAAAVSTDVPGARP